MKYKNIRCLMRWFSGHVNQFLCKAALFILQGLPTVFQKRTMHGSYEKHKFISYMIEVNLNLIDELKF
ncbi:hypothetical protein [Dialister invisus]|uniref:hypothetical protein n=1 Tax=Dialister invisus TaxID=218538 RepID=UPI003996949F